MRKRGTIRYFWELSLELCNEDMLSAVPPPNYISSIYTVSVQMRKQAQVKEEVGPQDHSGRWSKWAK